MDGYQQARKQGGSRVVGEDAGQDSEEVGAGI